ncbi:MAG: prepilin-type N-terminal cleavage/methylation domain-containing protein [Deltaproteobacteria bacterium]|nr:prepilin-type N-terminal cleavage/methylation domain-containing protein [Deltaproteobacteria bacterium]
MKTNLRSVQRGYTAVEVLSAMTLFAIGAAGVIGMQRVTIQGGTDARQFDMAVNIAHEWTNRLQRDSSYWTRPNAFDPQTTNLGTDTRWIKDVATCNVNFCTPPAAAPEAGLSGSFDIFGRDLPAASPDATYCAQYRLEWLIDPGPPPNMNPQALMRAEVRVFFSRTDRMPAGDCAGAAAIADSALANERLHFVYATTTIRQWQAR